MDSKVILEIVGYIGSILVVVSMLMTSVVKLRFINTIGNIISVIYATIVHAYPLAAMNFCLIIINVINLYRLMNSQKKYSVVLVNADDSFVKFFFDSYKDDIKKYFSNVEDIADCQKVFLVCDGSSPVGIFAGRETENHFDIKIDYTEPRYRDCSVGKFLYSYLASQGFRKVVATSDNATHDAYLSKMGFVRDGKGFSKVLN